MKARSNNPVKSSTSDREKKLFRAGKQNAALGNYADAIKQFNALLALKPTHAAAWFHKAKAHAALNQLAEAVTAYQEVTLISPELRGRAEACIADIHVLTTIATSAERDTLNSSPSKVLRNQVCTDVYLETFARLIQDHKNIANIDHNQRLAAIIRLIDFCQKFYTKQGGHFAFVRAEMIENNEAGRLARLQKVGNTIAKITIQNEMKGATKYAAAKTDPHRYAEILEEDSCEVIESVEEHVYLDDTMQALRMIIESIHQLEREKRGELVGRMPWGKNSWYHLDFCSTFFRSSAKAGIVPMFFTKDLSEEQVRQLLEFNMSMRYDILLVMQVMPEIISIDLPIIREFFAAVQAGLDDNDPRRMQDLPTLRPLLWHFKHSYQLLRLLAVLPSGCENNDGIMWLNAKDNQKKKDDVSDVLMTPIHQLFLCMFPGGFTQSLKLKFSMLRRIQVIGEVFSKRSWGSQLDELAMMDPDIFTTIRNGFSHPEDLTTTAVTAQIENNNLAIIAIHEELIKFRAVICNFIVQRQSKIPNLPDLSKINRADWDSVLQKYWLAVKEMYQLPDNLNSEDYCPRQPLLSAEKMDQTLHLLAGCRAYNQLVDMLNGVLPFSLPGKNEFDPEVELFPINKVAGVKLVGEEKRVNNENKKAIKTLDKLLAEANRKYASLKTTYLKNAKVDKEAKHAALKVVRTARMAELPALAKLAADFFAVFKNDAQNKPGINQIEMLTFLQSRISLLRQLLCEIPCYAAGNANADELKSKVSTDADLLYAFIYLITQIISLLNKLNSVHALSGISTELSARVEYYVLIRNALEHNDPVIDSLDETYIQMTSKSHMALCEIVLELCFKFHDDLMKATDKELTQNQAADKPPEKTTKQRKAMTLSSSDHPGFFKPMNEHPFRIRSVENAAAEKPPGFASENKL